MRLYIVRHGMCRHNMKQPELTQADPFMEPFAVYDEAVLVPQGVLQAELTGFRLRDVEFDAAMCSSLVRAVQTAATILKFQKRRIPLEVVRDLVEEGHFTHRFPPAPLAAMQKLWADIIPPTDPTRMGGSILNADDETKEEMQARARRVLSYLKKRFTGDEKVLLVSHGAFLYRYFLPLLLGAELERADYYAHSENCSIAVVDLLPNGTTSVITLNSLDHLGKAVLDSPF